MVDKEKIKNTNNNNIIIIIINFLSNRDILQQHSSGNIHFKRSVLLNKKGKEIIKILIGRHVILIIGKNQCVLTLEVGMLIIRRKRYVKQIETYKPD
ncbi:MAG TPA: hypothetical protein VHG34_02975 [Nitrososphaeraceae archaeon]|nr:hypothetical protein [Nitrososphaeraceae archaeon]